MTEDGSGRRECMLPGENAMATAGVSARNLSDAEHSAQLRRALVASTVGSVIEAYDFLLYVLREIPSPIISVLRSTS